MRDSKPSILAPGLTQAIALAFSIQTTISFLAAVAPVIAVEIAAARRWDVNAIALYLPVVYGVAFAVSFGMPALLAKHGAMWLGIICILLAALGETALLGPDWRIAILAPLLIGLAIGGMNPVTSQILSPHSSTGNASFITAIKQTGVPLGAAAAGLIGPLLVQTQGWTTAILYFAVAAALIAAALMPAAGRSRVAQSIVPAGHPLEPIRRLIAIPGMVAVIVAAITYVIAQFCLRSFFTVFLVRDLGWSLSLAGLAFTVSQVAGVAGQLGWAALSGRLMTHHNVLLVIGMLMALASALTGLATGSWPTFVVLGIAAVFGFTAAGFIPVVLGTVMQSSAVSEAGAMTSALNTFLIGGSLLGPLAFGAIAASFEYAGGFFVLAGFCLIGALSCAVNQPKAAIVAAYGR